MTFTAVMREPSRYIPRPLRRTTTTVISPDLSSEPGPFHSSSSSSSMTETIPLRGDMMVEGTTSSDGRPKG